MNPCDKSGREFDTALLVRPTCKPIYDSASNPEPIDELPASATRKNRRTIIAVSRCIIVASLLAALAGACKRENLAPTVVPHVDVADVRAKAERGEAQAQADLGRAYAQGLGVPQNYTEAAKWYIKAADQGNAAAQFALGELHEAGRGVARDDAAAAQC